MNLHYLEPGNDRREDKCFTVTDLLVSADWEQLEGSSGANIQRPASISCISVFGSFAEFLLKDDQL